MMRMALLLLMLIATTGCCQKSTSVMLQLNDARTDQPVANASIVVEYRKKIFPLILPDDVEARTDADGIALFYVAENKPYRMYIESDGDRLRIRLPYRSDASDSRSRDRSSTDGYRHDIESDRYIATIREYAISVKVLK